MAKPTTMNISLPESMRRYVEARMERGGFGNASEYIRHLIRADQKSEAQEQLELALLEGLNSGPGEEITPEWWAKKRAKLEKKIASKAKRPRKAG